MEKSTSKKRKKAKKRSRSSSPSSEDEKYKKRRHGQGDVSGKSWDGRRRKDSLSGSSDSSSSESDQEKIQKKRRKLKKKEKKKRKDKQKRDKREKRKKRGKERQDASELSGTVVTEMVTVSMPPENQALNESSKRRPMVPMTKEEYEKQQSQVRRVFDPETGRHRLVKGDGEIIEEVVSYQRHKEINKLATSGDGAAFQKSLGLHK
ncbi:ADP-ribosylation factor-like protein 6-interacting protein 4 isoform X2 [Dendronephthya gigantea]|uniref:ADP-ribosylation factor-like protein 6-interacting protein 4 isoform X2 n=1 Tax=Dendronephthya gigantea TaxID=151771 RepID=UPI00106A4FA2|nr:ADP-ribosylation factor-like protein 6-interacting protein 4 isoform X2 [Dendronephthya gigantea]